MKNDFVLRRCSVVDLVPGMEIGRAVYSDDGTEWLAEGSQLTEDRIRRLQILGISSLIIRDYRDLASFTEQEIAATIPEQEPVRSGVIAESEPVELAIAASELKATVSGQYEDVLASMRRIFSVMRVYQQLEREALAAVTEQVLAWTTHGSFITNFLHLIPRREDYLVQHCIHVAAISGIIGRLLDLPEQALRNVVLCGLVHDIGCLALPTEIFDKKETLSPDEFETVRSHPAIGYKMLQKLRTIPTDVLYGVLQHHERVDGSGYPAAADEKRIHLFGKIVGVADVYEAMTSKRAYREKVSPFTVMRTLNSDMLGKLDPTSSTAFLEYLEKSVLGNIVKLSDGSKAQIVFWHYTAPLPTVRTESGKFIDLSRDKTLSIIEIIEA